MPVTPLRFILYFLRESAWWYVGMALFEAAHATCGIMIPYAIGHVVKVVMSVKGQATSTAMAALGDSLLLFVALGAGEVLFARAGGNLQILLGPRQRQNVTRLMFAYLQQHSHRYFSSNFAGSLAHRISETAMGVNQTLWALLFDFLPVLIAFGVSDGDRGRAPPLDNCTS